VGAGHRKPLNAGERRLLNIETWGPSSNLGGSKNKNGGEGKRNGVKVARRNRFSRG